MILYLNSLTPTIYSLYNFNGATMTIKGSLQSSIPSVKAFLTRIFEIPSKIGQQFAIWGKMGSKCKILFSRPQKANPCAKRRHLTILIVKIGAGVLAVG